MDSYGLTTIPLSLTASHIASCVQDYVKLCCFSIFRKENLTKISAPPKKIIIFVTNVDVTQVNLGRKSASQKL